MALRRSVLIRRMTSSPRISWSGFHRALSAGPRSRKAAALNCSWYSTADVQEQRRAPVNPVAYLRNPPRRERSQRWQRPARSGRDGQPAKLSQCMLERAPRTASDSKIAPPSSRQHPSSPSSRRSGSGQTEMSAELGKHAVGTLPQGKVFYYNTRIQALRDQGKWHEALELYSRMKSDGVAPDVFTICKVLSVLARANLGDRIQGVLHDMQSLGISPSVELCNTLITAYGRNGQYDNAFRVTKMMQTEGIEPTLVTYNALIAVCQRSLQLDRAFELLEELEAENLEPDIVTFNTIITACRKARQWERTFLVFDDMNAKGVKPDVFTYSTLMSACERMEQWDRAMLLYEEMERSGVKPDVVVYATLLSACAAAGRFDETRRIVDTMKAEASQTFAELEAHPQLKPNKRSFSAAIWACREGGHWRRADELLALMKRRGVSPDLRDYTDLIVACGRGGEWARGLEILEEMRGNIRSVNGKIRHAKRSPRANGARPVRPDRIAYNALLSAIERSGGGADTALRLLGEMKRDGLAPDAHTYNALVRICVCDEVLTNAVLEDMHQDGVAPDVITVNSLIATNRSLPLEGSPIAAGHVDRAFDALRRMQEASGADSLQPDRVTYCELVNVCSKAGQWERASALVEGMKVDQIAPDLPVYNALLDALANGAQAKRAEVVFAEIIAAGLKPDVVTHTALLSALCAAGRTRDALRVLIEIRDAKLDTRIGCERLAEALHRKVGISGTAVAERIVQELREFGLNDEAEALHVMLATLSQVDGKVATRKDRAEQQKVSGAGACTFGVKVAATCS